MPELGQEALAELNHGFHISFKLISSELAGTFIFHNLLTEQKWRYLPVP